MLSDLKPYAKYKVSGLPWLGKMPAHWEVRRNGRLFGPRRETGFPDLPILAVSIRTGVRVRDLEDGARKQQMTDRTKYQRALRGDIAYNMMRMWQGAVGVAPTDGLVSPAYIVARPFPETSAAYYAYLFRTVAYMREIETYSRGIVPDRNRLYWESFKQMPSAFPPIEEQRSIVRFLDWHGAQTAKLVRAKRKELALLKEKKQAIVRDAVTGGCALNAMNRPSGGSSHSNISEFWQIKRLRNAADLRVSNVDKKSIAGERQIRLCNYVDVYKNEAIHAAIPFMTATATTSEIRRFRLQTGDVIITKDSEDWRDIGVPALVTTEADDLVCGYHLAVLRPREGIYGPFLYWRLLSPDVSWQFSVAATGVTRYGLSHDAIKSVLLSFPDSNAQRAIAEQLDRATAGIRRVENGIGLEINLVDELRTRLIAEVVTGKLDVRALAADLPTPESVAEPALAEPDADLDDELAEEDA